MVRSAMSAARSAAHFQITGQQRRITFRVADDPSLEPASNVTVDAWVRAPSSPGGFRYIVSKGAFGDTGASYALGTDGAGGLRFYIYSQAAGFVIAPTVAPAAIWDGQWHHVAGSYDGSTVRLYVDGTEIGTGTPTTGNLYYGLPTQNDLIIGNFVGQTVRGPFTGDIDELSVYGRTLSPAEIRGIFNAGTLGKGNAAGNTQYGVEISSFFPNTAGGNTIGGQTLAARNVISENAESGVTDF